MAFKIMFCLNLKSKIHVKRKDREAVCFIIAATRHLKPCRNNYLNLSKYGMHSWDKQMCHRR